VRYYKNPIPLKYHIFLLCDNTKYHISKLVLFKKWTNPIEIESLID